MDKLLNPEVGLMVWTLVTFAGLVFVLKRFAWTPILAALDSREDSIRQNIQAAEHNKKASEDLRKEYEARLADVEAKSRDVLARAEAQARAAKEDILRAAHAENERWLDEARKKLAEEERRLVRSVRSEMASWALSAAEKMLRRGLDKSFQDRLLKEALDDFDKARPC